MQQNNQNEWSEERKELLNEIAQLTGLIHGTWVERYSTCSRPDCPYHKDQKKRHGPRAYVVINEQGKQRQKYVPNSQKAAVSKGIEQYKRLLAIAERISQINILMMRAQTLDREPEMRSLGTIVQH